MFSKNKKLGKKGGNIFLGKVVDRFVLGDYWWFGFSGFLRVLGVNGYINIVHAYKLTNTNWLPKDTVIP